MKAQLSFVHALSPLHPGTGQGVGVIDLPIAREVATGLPYLPGSSLKGVLRDQAHHLSTQTLTDVFGPETENAPDHAGSVQLTDQRLLLFPVRSLKGTFAWATSPFVLQRFARDIAAVGVQGMPTVMPSIARTGQVMVTEGSGLMHNGKLYLEDLDLAAQSSAGTTQWANWIGKQLFPNDEAWRSVLTSRFCILHDDVLSFLLSTATEVIARIRMKRESTTLEDGTVRESSTKTVADGGLWYEEALPAETVLSGMVVATPVKASVDTVFSTIRTLVQSPLQLGGNATVGRGLCQIYLVGGSKA